ncbi:uncharacterized protein LOC120623931 [Pararge aegeria]|uniref:uncharacterized protein LOC120623931 n=1 Tax=Pararge aegeria TaxID=116150 RepID=UPI0019D1B2D2|nr:uncharacterized protein LOC120623931 [Pararge aegeria]
MQSLSYLSEDEVSNPLPPLISTNLREKLIAEQVCIDGITHKNLKKKSVVRKENDHHILKKQQDIGLICSPSVLDLEIDDVEIVKRLRIWSASPRSIYLHCCGFWDETCRLGAYWNFYPRTRFNVVPGLPIDIYVKATPRDSSHVPYATIALQLAAAFKRDLIVAYFVVPIRVKFLKYLSPPRLEECE